MPTDYGTVRRLPRSSRPRRRSSPQVIGFCPSRQGPIRKCLIKRHGALTAKGRSSSRREMDRGRDLDPKRILAGVELRLDDKTGLGANAADHPHRASALAHPGSGKHLEFSLNLVLGSHPSIDRVSISLSIPFRPLIGKF